MAEDAPNPFHLPFDDLDLALAYGDIVLDDLIHDGNEEFGIYDINQPMFVIVDVGEPGSDGGRGWGVMFIGSEFVGPRPWSAAELDEMWPPKKDRDCCPACYGELWWLMPDAYQCAKCYEWFQDDPDCDASPRPFKVLRLRGGLAE